MKSDLVYPNNNWYPKGPTAKHNYFGIAIHLLLFRWKIVGGRFFSHGECKKSVQFFFLACELC